MTFMRATLAISLIIAVIFNPSPAYANWKDGNQIYENCNAEKDDVVYHQNYAACLFYILGVVDALQLGKSLYKNDDIFCIPENVRAGQLSAIVLKYLKDHPEERHWSASALVALALKGAFPCKLIPSAKP
jgi:Rap1a immunity proteins